MEAYEDERVGERAEEAELARARAQVYRLLASVFFRELDEGQIEHLRQAPLPAQGNERMERGAAEIFRYLRLAAPDVLTLLRVDYARIFLAAGVFEGDTAVPYESVFTGEEGLMMQEARDDVLRYYAREGVVVEKALQTPEDHLSFELEFLAITCEREAEALERADDGEAGRLRGVQLAFARGHVLNWIDLLAERVRAYAVEALYPAFMEYAAGFVADDVAYLEERAV